MPPCRRGGRAACGSRHVTWRCHSSGISDSTASRARISSPRLVSCVEVPSIACGQRLGALRIGLVEGRQRDAELIRMAADLVQRDEAVVAIERGVLETFRHHRAAVLLHPHGEAQRPPGG